MAKVYMTDRITPESLVHIYEAMGISLTGRVAVKISTGEPGGHNFLQPDLIKDLVHRLKGTIVECNTAYEGRRNTTQAHWQTIHDHGFAALPHAISWMRMGTWQFCERRLSSPRELCGEPFGGL